MKRTFHRRQVNARQGRNVAAPRWRAGVYLTIVLGAPAVLSLAVPGRASAADVLVESGSAMTYLANDADPGLGISWVPQGFDDSGWSAGTYGVGYESGTGAENLIHTPVTAGSFSVYTRAAFTVTDVNSVGNLFLGVDYDDGFVAWINGSEVLRAAQMPAGEPDWNTNSALHEASNGSTPNYQPLQDISSIAIPLLQNGTNVLAIGVWNNNAPSSTDLVLVPRLSANESASVSRGPYLQSGTETGVVVRWRTTTPTDSRVRFGDAPGNLLFVADDLGVTTEHIVSVAGLTPNNVYYYSVGSTAEELAGNDADHFFVTSPPTGIATPTRVWILGDSGTADANAAAVRDAFLLFNSGASPDLWLMLGDNAYNDGTDQEYQAAVFDMYPTVLRNTVLWPTLGNHDGHTADSATQSGPYYDIFTLPTNGEAGGLASGTEAYYSFDHANIHFVCLESFETDRSVNGAMMTWLQQDVADTTQDWVIAFWHHPPYSKGSHNSDNEVELVEMRENALPILEGAGVDLVFGGHSHSYERSFLIDGHYDVSGTFTESMKKDGGDGRPDGNGAYEKPALGPDPHRGAVYVVAGSSGKISGGPLNHPAMFLSVNSLGSVVLDVDGSQLDATFLDDAGTVVDYYRILKGTGTPPVAPAALAATAASSSQIDLAWTDNSDNEDGFEIERSLDGASWSLLFTTSPDVTNHSDNGLDALTTYHYRVRAVNSVGVSPYSNVASDTTLEPGPIDSVANGEIAVSGTVNGTFADTQVSDQVVESILERESGGKPANRHSFLEHKWTVFVVSGDTVTFFVKAYRTASPDGDDFVFAYSTDDATYTDMVTVTKTSDDGTYQTFDLPGSVSGNTVYVRVLDTDQSQGNRDLDTIFVDHLFIRSQPAGPGTPPDAPSALVAQPISSSRIDLSWTDNSTDEDGFAIERSLDGSSWQEIATVPAGATAYSDTGLAALTTYDYRVLAFNSFGDSAFSNTATATTLDPGAVDDVATSETPVAGSVTGTFVETQTGDGVYESIRERTSGGKPATRFDFLEHKWVIDVSGGADVTFFVKAYKTASNDGDDFVFAYSLDDVSYADMLTVSRTSDDGTYQTFSLPDTISGTVHIRVSDTDQTAGNASRDTIFVDHLFIRSE